MRSIKEELLKLKDADIYSLVMFALYKMNNIPEYSTLSELAYLMDKEHLLKLCEYFGGMTIRIPTIDELENMVYSLVLYQWVNIDGMPYEKAVAQIGCPSDTLRTVKSQYLKLVEILDNYSFNARGQ
jgi:hypothetical protein